MLENIRTEKGGGMHIPDGVLSAPVLAAGGVLTALGVAVGLMRIDYDRIMSVAILGSAFFVASLVHVPVGPSSVHLLLTGILGLVLGWAAFPAILVGLLLQAIFFQYGGIVVLGVNTLNMACPAVLCALICRPFLSTRSKNLLAFMCGFGAVLLSGTFTAASLALTDGGFLQTASLLLVAHLPVAFIEGILSVFILSFIFRVQPEILGNKIVEKRKSAC